MKSLTEYRMLFEKINETEPKIHVTDLGLRSKLGGHPDWVQNDETPQCKECN